MSYRCRVIHSPLQLLLQLIWLGGNRRFQRLVIPRLALTGGFNRTLSLSFFVSLSVHLRKPGKRKSSSNPLLRPYHPPPPPPLLPLPFHRRRRYPSQYAGPKLWWRGQEITCRFPCHLFPKAQNSRGWKTYFKCICACGDKGEGSLRTENKGKERNK